MRPWFDTSRTVEERLELLVAEMTVAEKCGLVFHPIIGIGPGGTLADADPHFGLESNAEYVLNRHLTHFNLIGAGDDAREIARWHNALQRLAASTRLGIPVTLSTDSRHAFTDNPGTGTPAGEFSQWPEMLGLAAIGDDELVEQFADIARQEYSAVGFRVALSPQIDLATEPRWSRVLATFGEDAELTSRLGAAFISGMQGSSFGPGSVSTMTKHFPGGGPQKDGEDPHFAYGREQVYSGGQFDLHLRPFEAALAAGTRQIMPYYGMPIGTEYEEVGFGFNKSLITGLLRETLGFDGIVCSDWGIITDAPIMGDWFPARAWGAEHLTPEERILKAIDAGVDQFGGESQPAGLVNLVEQGHVTLPRLDTSVRRLLREKFALGLFDDPYVDEDAVARVVGCPEFRALGQAAQRASITVLTNEGTDGQPLLPLRPAADSRLKLYVEGIGDSVAADYGVQVTTPGAADVAILRIDAPYDKTRRTAFERMFHAGSLEFPAEVIDHVRAVASAAPVVLDVFCDRPAILTPFMDAAEAIVVNWGAHPRALLDVLFGYAEPKGHLPFDLPSSGEAVDQSNSDVPFDTHDPLFRFGHGLTWRSDPATVP